MQHRLVVSLYVEGVAHRRVGKDHHREGTGEPDYILAPGETCQVTGQCLQGGEGSLHSSAAAVGVLIGQELLHGQGRIQGVNFQQGVYYLLVAGFFAVGFQER